MEDIGFLLFSQLLGMTQYPGSPFTGNLFKDIIMFLVVPMIFIIIIVFTMTGRVVPGQPRIRILLGIGAFLFIVAGGYYPAFAYFAGPYFVFLIFIMGLLFYIFEHFTGSRPKEASGGGQGGAYPVDNNRMKKYLGIPELNPVEIKLIKKDIEDLDERINKAEKAQERMLKNSGTGDAARVAPELDRMYSERQALMRKLRGG